MEVKVTVTSDLVLVYMRLYKKDNFHEIIQGFAGYLSEARSMVELLC